MIYFARTPWWIKKSYPGRIWEFETTKNVIYLTFDDGPHPEATSFVLDELKKFDAKATFFCIGKNVANNYLLYERIIYEGHGVGNHTYDHLNGWKTNDTKYLDNISEAKKIIDSNLFRPPYGKITGFQLSQLSNPRFRLKTIMWSVLSGDFDNDLSTDKCLQNVLFNTRAGSIIVFHDSENSMKKLEYVLPRVLTYFANKDFSFEKIS